MTVSRPSLSEWRSTVCQAAPTTGESRCREGAVAGVGDNATSWPHVLPILLRILSAWQRVRWRTGGDPAENCNQQRGAATKRDPPNGASTTCLPREAQKWSSQCS